MGVGGVIPGGNPIFREDAVHTIGDMIQRWEKMEKEEGRGEQKKEGRRNSWRRVSELSMRFEVSGDLITEGGGGDHINQPGGGPSILKGQSSKQKSLISSPRLSKNVKTSERIFKLNSNSKSKFKVRVNSQDGSTESGVSVNGLDYQPIGSQGHQERGIMDYNTEG